MEVRVSEEDENWVEFSLSPNLLTISTITNLIPSDETHLFDDETVSTGSRVGGGLGLSPGACPKTRVGFLVPDHTPDDTPPLSRTTSRTPEPLTEWSIAPNPLKRGYRKWSGLTGLQQYSRRTRSLRVAASWSVPTKVEHSSSCGSPRPDSSPCVFSEESRPQRTLVPPIPSAEDVRSRCPVRVRGTTSRPPFAVVTVS